MTSEIEIVPCLSDNYAYLVKSGEACAVVDPSEARAGASGAEAAGLEADPYPQHPSPSGPFRRQSGPEAGRPARWWSGPGKDAARIPGLDVGVDEASGWEFDGRTVQVLEVPAHTRGAITFVIDGNAFTGDTLFLMGCGRLFEGDPQMMWTSLSKLMTLPDETRIYCGHEYTESNGRFALTLEPGNPALQARVAEVKATRAKGAPTVPATMGIEKQTNPFLRPDNAEIRKSLGMEKAGTVAAFGEIRARKEPDSSDSFHGRP